jgi:hypothetical protein
MIGMITSEQEQTNAGLKYGIPSSRSSPETFVGARQLIGHSGRLAPSALEPPAEVLDTGWDDLVHLKGSSSINIDEHAVISLSTQTFFS